MPSDSLESAFNPHASSHGLAGAEPTRLPLNALTSNQTSNCNARACLQSPACKEKRDQIEEAGKAGVGLLVAGCDASECFERAEEVFDQMTPFVHFGIVRDAPGPAGHGGDNRGRAAFLQIGAQPVVVEGLVADQSFKIEISDQGLDADAV